MNARELIAPGKSAVVVFTHGLHFVRREDGSGSTGNWKISLSRKFDRVIMYHRLDSATANEVYTADADGTEASDEVGRRIILLKNVVHRGSTTSKWPEFAEGHTNPVRYF